MPTGMAARPMPDAPGRTRRQRLVLIAALAAAIARITVSAATTNEDQAARDWTRWLMMQPLGRVLLGLIAAAIVGVGESASPKRFFRAPIGATSMPGGCGAPGRSRSARLAS